MPGTLDSDLAQLEVSGLSHARWLTLAGRILRYYTFQTNSSKTLRILVEFCSKVYFPSWFSFKLNLKITEAAANYFRMLKKINQFSYKHPRDIAFNTLIGSGFSAHPRSFFLAAGGQR